MYGSVVAYIEGGESFEEQVVREVLYWANKKRHDIAGSAKMSIDNTLDTLAGIIIQDNLVRMDISHDTTYGQDFDNRAFASCAGGWSYPVDGEPFSMLGEMIALTTDFSEGVGMRLVGNWLSSTTGHREALLNPSMKYCGIAVGVGLYQPFGRDGIYCAMILGY